MKLLTYGSLFGGMDRMSAAVKKAKNLVGQETQIIKVTEEVMK